MDWALRLKHEAKFHNQAFFITLTYNDENVPADGSLDPKHVKNFIRRYRREFGKTRFFSCAEYGGKLQRPHYHVIAFGPDIPDRVQHYRDYPQSQFNPAFRAMFGESGIIHYRSPRLEKCWPFGFSEFTYAAPATMDYVTKFHVEKVTGEKAADHYGDRVPEFSRMSRMPGMGTQWLEKYWREIYPHGYVQDSSGGKFSPPKFYDRWLETNHPEVYADVKKRRTDSIGFDKYVDYKREAIATNRGAMLDLKASLGSGQFKNSKGVTAADLARSASHVHRQKRR